MAARRSRALEIIMAMDTSGVSAGMRRVSNETGQFGRQASVGARATNKLRSAFLGAAAAAGGAAAAYVSVAQAREAIVTTQELALATVGLERNLGLATKQASRWAAVTRARGVDSKALTMGFTSLSRAIEGAKDGAESSLKPFQALGISQKEIAATGGNFSKQVLLVADALGKAEGSSTRQAAAAKLLGRGYQTILPMFTEGAKGLQEQLKWADEFGATMGKDTVQAMSDFTTAQRRSRVAVMGLQIAFAKHATPALTAALDKFGEFVSIINSGSLSRADKLARLRTEFQKLRDDVLKLVTDLAPQIAQAAGEIGVELAKGIGKAFMETGFLGKVAITALVFRAFGGVAAITAAGRAWGAIFGRAAATTTAAQMAGASAAAGAGGAAAGAAGLMARVGRFAKVGTALTAVFGALEIAQIKFNRKADDLQSRLEQIDNQGKGIIGTFSRWMDGGTFGSFGELFGTGKLTEAGDAAHRLKQQLEEIVSADREHFRVLKDSIMAQMTKLDLTKDEERTIKRIIGASKVGQQNARGQQFDRGAAVIASGNLVGSDLQAVVDRQLRQINDTYNRYTPRWSEKVELTMNAQITAIRAAYSKGGRLTREGMALIQAIITRRQRLLASGDPIGIARGIANGWKNARNVNQVNVRGFIRRLQQMSPAAKRTAGATMLNYARELQAKGKLPDGTVAKLRSKLIRHLGADMWRKIQSTARDGLGKLDGTTKKTGNKFGEMADAAVKANRRIANTMRQLPTPVTTSLRTVRTQFEKSAGAISSYRPGSFQAKRRGGLIGLRDEGTARGGRGLVPVKVAPGELIAYKGRSMVVPGTNDKKDSVGMMLPVGTQVFTYHGQELLARGYSPKQALEKQVPHFNSGGLVRPRITGGTAKGREVGNKAIDRTRGIAWNRLKTIHKAARKLFVGGPGVTRSYPGLSGDTDFVPALGWMLSALARATVGNISVTSGYRSYAEQAALFAANPNPRMVAPPGRSNHGRGIAADIGPQRPSYGGKERQFGLNFPMSWEPWHIELSGTPKFPGIGQFIAPGYRKGGWVKTGYTVFDDLGGGYRGHLQQGNGYAELGTATQGGIATGMGYLAQALGIPGELAEKFPLDVKINGRRKRMVKRDRGYGQGSSAYGIDIYKDSWPFFGISGNSSGVAHVRIAATKKQIEKVQGKAGDVLGRVRKSRKSGGAKGYLDAAKDNAKRARKMAGNGNIWGARKRLEKAREQIKSANQNRTKPSNPKTNKPPSKTPGLGALPEAAKKLLNAPGLSIDDKLAIYDYAATIAEGTTTAADDEAVRKGRISLQKQAVAKAKRAIRKANKDIAKYKQQAQSSNKKKANAARQKLANARDRRSSAFSDLSTARSEISSLTGGEAGGTNANDLASAMKELADAIAEQNRMQASVQAVSSREALKMLSDVISGQIVGKRAAVTTTPQGVRY